MTENFSSLRIRFWDRNDENFLINFAFYAAGNLQLGYLFSSTNKAQLDDFLIKTF